MIETLGSLGSFIGGFGVIISVVYLAIQIRQNTKSLSSAAYQQIVTSISDWSRAVAMDPEAVRIVSSGINDDGLLTPAELAQFDLLMVSLLRNYENVHFQYLSGALPESSWHGWSSRILGTLNNPGSLSWWRRQQGAYSPSFQQFVDLGIGQHTETAIPLWTGNA
ncbi:MAG: hypothetical protein JKY89_03565 [Immundisolibacteraceae bacterium]|nr:hypothetical protein [Immundisolibacteraceae bacterium]